MNRQPPGPPPFPPRRPHPGQGGPTVHAGPSFEPRRYPPTGRPPQKRPAPGGRRPHPKKSSSSLLTVLLSIILFAVVVVGGAIGYLVINPPSDLIRQTIVDQVKQKTGRDLVVAGPAKFTFWPGLGVSLGDVTFSGPAGGDQPLLTMRALDVSVQTLPLLQKQIAVEQLHLDQPVFNLKVDRQGRRNWDFARATPKRQLAAASTDAYDQRDLIRLAAANNETARSNRLAALRDLELSDVTIRKGTVRYLDERTGEQQQLTGINLSASLPGLNKVLSAEGDVLHRGQKLDLKAELSTPADIIAERPAKLKLTASNPLAKFNYDGTISVGGGADLAGRIAVESPSARRAAAWLGTELPPVAGFGPLAIKGNVKTAGNVTRLEDASFTLDSSKANGTIVVTTGGVRPAVKANLRIASLDLNNYLTAAAGGGNATGDSDASGARGQPAPSSEPGRSRAEDKIEKLLKRDSGPTRVYGAVHRAGWSSEPINLALLGVADIDANLATGPLQFRKIKIDQAEAQLTVKDRKMRTDFTRLNLYDGNGRGTLNVDAQGQAAAVKGQFALDSMTAESFLKDASDIDWLAGKANVTLNFTTTGTNQLQLVETLNGQSQLNFTKGAIIGFNIAGAIRNLTQGNFSGLRKSPAEKTDFSEMSASFNIANGIATNSDLALISPLLRVTGEGQINLPGRTVDYTARPKLVASLEGQGADGSLSGLEIPVRIVGPLDNPRYQPDFKGVLENPDKAVEAVQEIGKRLKGKNSGEIMDELFGKGDSDTKSKAKNLLNQFFNKN